MLQLEVIGNIGNDAEIKNFNGKEYVSFSVAHTERRRDSQGNMSDSTMWVSVLWFGNGGNLLQYLKKGCKVFVRGRLAVKTFTTQRGEVLPAINVNASEVTLCGSKGETAQASQGNTYAAPAPTAAPVQPAPVGESDDLPF